jgi:hypothetical protein
VLVKGTGLLLRLQNTVMETFADDRFPAKSIIRLTVPFRVNGLSYMQMIEVARCNGSTSEGCIVLLCIAKESLTQQYTDSVVTRLHVSAVK